MRGSALSSQTKCVCVIVAFSRDFRVGDFAYVSVTRISVSDVGIQYTLMSIGDYAFQYCSSLMSIALPAGLTSLGPGAFYGCSSMASIDLPAGGRVR